MATNPFAQFVQEETNPFAQFAVPTPVTPPGQIPGAPAAPTTTVTGLAGAATRGLAVPAAGAALGAAIGAPLAGVGAIPGAIAGAGAATLAQFVGDPIVSSVNSLLGTKYRLPTEAMEDLLTRLGVAQPRTEAERIVQAMAAGAGGAGGMAAAGRAVQAAAGQAAPVAREVGRMMAAQPITQVAGGAGAGAAGQIAQEAGVGPLGQIGAALAGGVAGATAAAPIVGKGLEKLAALPGRALDFKGKQATKIAREAAGEQIDAIRAALRGAPAGETPAQATAGIQRNAFQSLLELGRETDQMSLTLKKQSDDLLSELSRMAQGGNQTDIANSIDASRKVLNALTRPMRETSLDAANQQKANSLNYVNTMLQRVFLQKQVPPPQGLQPLSVDRIIGAIDEARMQPGARVSTTQQQVLGRLRSQLLNAAEINGGTIDAYDLYTIRKEGVNEIIDALMVGRDPKVSKKVAADVLSIVRPEIDNAIERAGGAGWKNYLETFSKGAKDLEKRQMAAELLRMFKDSPQEYVKLVRGNNPSAVEAVFGPGNYDIFKEMSKEMSTLNKVAAYVEREGIITKASEKGREELARILKKHRKYTLIPNWFNPYVTAANMKLRDIQGRLNDETLRVIERAAQSNQSMLDLLEGLPRAERSKLMKMINGLGRMGAPGSAEEAALFKRLAATIQTQAEALPPAVSQEQP